MPFTLNDLRRFAITRSLFKPTTLKRAIHKLGFVQADPIRAPARAGGRTGADESVSGVGGQVNLIQQIWAPQAVLQYRITVLLRTEPSCQEP